MSDLGLEVIPSARRLMESLRDIGYDLPAAVADLVDNSLDADALRVDVDLTHDDHGGWVRIADDGLGMTERELDEAMRYGSSRSYRKRDLGSFGLGLKTASLSQCRSLTVATRSTVGGPIRVRRWDLDRVARTDAWELERLAGRSAPPQALEPLDDGTGTVVLWQRPDRILGTRRVEGDAAARRLEGAAQEIATHLAMVFHRFLAGEATGPRVALHVNGRELGPWDPFARDEKMTRRLRPQMLTLEHSEESHEVAVQPWILPAQHHFSSGEAHERAAGPKRWNRQQGLYIYRSDRLVQSGGWNRLRTLDEHSKLARIALDIPVGADDAFRTNVSKMTVALPDALRAPLRALVAGVAGSAQDIYRRRVTAVPDLERSEKSASSPDTALSVGDQWPHLVEVLTTELGDQVNVLDRVLVALANLAPPRGLEDKPSDQMLAKAYHRRRL
ncbi:MAG: ATP-binding protein [Actinomycetota bacterium]|nr:ATP-binding protein [Actinomycetota bacterium]